MTQLSGVSKVVFWMGGNSAGTYSQYAVTETASASGMRKAERRIVAVFEYGEDGEGGDVDRLKV